MMKRYLEATSLHQQIADLVVRDDYVLKGLTAEDLGDALVGCSFERTHRHGKNLLVGLGQGRPWLRLHFGMTGNLRYFQRPAAEPQYGRILFAFTNGCHLAYVSQRKLGRVSLHTSVQDVVEDLELGPDARRVSLEQFLSVMNGRRGGVKSTLMNQHIIAGLGNVYVDEVLWQARLHPQRRLDEMDEAQLTDMHRVMQHVLESAIARGADARNMPADWLIGHRAEADTCPRCGAEIRRTVIGQRGTCFCPACQPPPR